MRGGHVTHLRHLAVSGSDGTVVLAGGGVGGGCVELWASTVRSVTLHAALRCAAGGYSRSEWRHVASVSHGSVPTALAVPHFALSGATPLLQYVAVGYRDGTVKLVDRATLQPVTTTNLDVGDLTAPGGPTPAHMVHMRQTLTGCVLLGVDQTDSLYVMRVANSRDPVTQVAPLFLVGMLEYQMLTGYDWWDVIAAIRPGNGRSDWSTQVGLRVL